MYTSCKEIFMKKYSLRKCRKILRSSHSLYLRKKKKLIAAHQERFENLLKALQIAIESKDKQTAERISKSVEEFCKQYLPKTLLDKIYDFTLSLIVAIIAAIIIRQMWFELYTIPSGSMRPTLKENDFLVVSKTDFGINTLTPTSHLYFDPNLVKRGSIVIFSVANMDVADPDTTYFLIIPGKKQYVKRLIAKPGDSIYFYGGLIYGVDDKGSEIKEFRNLTCFERIEHIPFIKFEGKSIMPRMPTHGIYSPVILYQMNEPIAKMSITPYGHLKGSVIHSKIENFYDLIGIKNFAMAKIAVKNRDYYLELYHHPSINSPKLGKDEYGRLRPMINSEVSSVKLSEEHLKKIFSHMTTCRFTVKNGLAAKQGVKIQGVSIKLNVPDGSYEFINGQAYRVFWQGLTKKLSKEHPLANFSMEQTALLFNMGMDFDYMHKLPSRYAYFRDHDLYTLNFPLLQKNEPELVNFLQSEYQKQSASMPPYVPFEDLGPPLKSDGQIDSDFIRKYGLKIPEKMYLVLGDNHAHSADSRVFGFVPEANLRGTAKFIFWPPQGRFGTIDQPHEKLICIPRIVIWSLAGICSIIVLVYLRMRSKRPLKF